MNFLVPRTRRNLAPWSGINEFEAQMNRLFNGWPEWMDNESTAWTPAVDLKENENDYELIADLPGMTKDDINLTVVDDVVTLKGERKNEQETDKEGYHRIERSYGAFQRSFRIPEGVEANKVDAHFNDGVLKVKLPKSEARKPKQIEVKVH